MTLLKNSLDKNTSPVVSRATDEAANNNQSIVLPGAFGKNNNLGQANTSQNVAVAPGATATYPGNETQAESEINPNLPKYTAIGGRQRLNQDLRREQSKNSTSSNNNGGGFAAFKNLLDSYNTARSEPEYAGSIQSYTGEPEVGSRYQTNTGIDWLDNLNAERNLQNSINAGQTQAWSDIQKYPEAERNLVLESINDTNGFFGDLGSGNFAYRYQHPNDPAYSTYAEAMAEGKSPEESLNEAYQSPINEALFWSPFGSATQNEIEEKARDAIGEQEQVAIETKEQELEDIASQPDATYSMVSYAGFGVDEEAALDEFCNERGLGYVEDNPDRAMMAFQLNGSHDEWHDYVRAYPSLYDGFDEFAYDGEGNQISLYNMPDALFDVCFENWWNHYKPITVDQYFDFEDEAGNYTYNGTVTLDVFALCGSSETVMQEWANALAENYWWNSEDLANMANKYSNDENYDFAINSNGQDEYSNLYSTNAQAWLLTLFANAEKEATLKAQEATDYRRNPDSPWLGNSTSRGINVWPEQITEEEGLNHSTYWLNPDLIYLGGTSDNGDISFYDLGTSDDYYGTDYLYNPSANKENPDYRMATGGSITNEFSPVAWEGPATPTYNNYTMRNSGKAFEGLPYWTSEANQTQNANDTRDIYSYTAPITYGENPNNYPYYNPYAMRDMLATGQISGTAYDQEEE